MTTIISPDDTRVREFLPTNNYSTSLAIYVCDEITSSNRSYILMDFDLSGETTSLTSAKLNIYCAEATPSLTIYVRRINASWTVSTVTWNTKPTYTNTNQTSFTTALGILEWHIIDVTQLVKDCITNSGYGLQLMADSSDTGDNKFWAVDNATLKPFLEINYADKYVDIATGSDSDSGDDWASAYLTVKKGIDNVSGNNIIHIAEGDYSTQATIDLDKNLELVCEDYGGGNASPPLTVVLPPTA